MHIGKSTEDLMNVENVPTPINTTMIRRLNIIITPRILPPIFSLPSKDKSYFDF